MPPAWLTTLVGLALAAAALLPLSVVPVFPDGALLIYYSTGPLLVSMGGTLFAALVFLAAALRVTCRSGGGFILRSRSRPSMCSSIRRYACCWERPLSSSITHFGRCWGREALTRTACPCLAGSRAGNPPRPSAFCRRAAPASAAQPGSRNPRSGLHPEAGPDRLRPARVPSAAP